ncbi:DUF4837 family protein [Porphyromonas macacae]|uniref:DUF4837 family protein n=1 Tax=Porphyromonas macacae TaxID=28115 RepID=UPI000AB0B10D|nr:DUF4837 family protein [Porphyromonas macacae]
MPTINHRTGNTIKIILTCSAILLGLGSCSNGGGGGTFTRSTGKPGEVMLAINKKHLNDQTGKKIQNMLVEPAIGLPQNEASMRVSRVNLESFDSFLRYVRNVLLVDVDPERFTTTSLKYSYDEWSKGQIVIRINSVSPDSLNAYIDRNKEGIMNRFINHELFLFGEVLEKSYSGSADRNADSIFNHRINAPGDIVGWKFGKDFLWMSNSLPRKRHDLLIYTYPYTGQGSLGIDRMTEMRDSVLRENIQGAYEDSYPTTQREYSLYHRYVTMHDGTVRGELRGLWHMHGKARMGGPFVSQAYANKEEGKVYVVEGFVYNPNDDLLTLLRMMESMLYTFRPGTEKKFDPENILKCKYTRMN